MLIVALSSFVLHVLYRSPSCLLQAAHQRAVLMVAPPSCLLHVLYRTPPCLLQAALQRNRSDADTIDSQSAHIADLRNQLNCTNQQLQASEQARKTSKQELEVGGEHLDFLIESVQLGREEREEAEGKLISLMRRSRTAERDCAFLCDAMMLQNVELQWYVDLRNRAAAAHCSVVQDLTSQVQYLTQRLHVGDKLQEARLQKAYVQASRVAAAHHSEVQDLTTQVQDQTSQLQATDKVMKAARLQLKAVSLRLKEERVTKCSLRTELDTSEVRGVDLVTQLEDSRAAHSAELVSVAVQLEDEEKVREGLVAQLEDSRVACSAEQFHAAARLEEEEAAKASLVAEVDRLKAEMVDNKEFILELRVAYSANKDELEVLKQTHLACNEKLMDSRYKLLGMSDLVAEVKSLRAQLVVGEEARGALGKVKAQLAEKGIQLVQQAGKTMGFKVKYNLAVKERATQRVVEEEAKAALAVEEAAKAALVAEVEGLRAQMGVLEEKFGALIQQPIKD
jgi:hypothetical protein